MTAMIEANSERIRAHEANLDRYCHLLLTELTSDERRYLHKCIDEEQEKLARLQAEELKITAIPGLKVLLASGGHASH